MMQNYKYAFPIISKIHCLTRRLSLLFLFLASLILFSIAHATDNLGSMNELLIAQKNYQEVKNNFDKVNNLHDNAQEQLKQAKKDLIIAQKKVAESQANLNQAQFDLKSAKQTLEYAKTRVDNAWNKAHPQLKQ